MIQVSIQLVCLLIFVMFAFLLVFYFCLLLSSHVQETKSREKEDYKKRSEKLWYDYFILNKPFVSAMVPGNENEIKGFEEIASVYIKNVSSPDIKQKLQEFTTVYLHDYYKQQLKSRKRSRRINVLNRIAEYGNLHVLNGTEKTKERSRDEEFLWLKIYSLHAPDTFLELFFLQEYQFSECEYRKIFAYLDAELLFELFDRFETMEAEAQYAWIDTMALSRNIQFLNESGKLLQHTELEIRIRSLKVLYEIGTVEKQVIRTFLHSAIWQERLMAVKLCRYRMFKEIEQELLACLEDQHWQVRSQAARIIKHHTGGVQALQKFVETSKDQYALETVREMLGEEVHVQWSI